MYNYQDGTNLRIYQLSEKDDGEYTCELETKVQLYQLCTVALNLFKMRPIFSQNGKFISNLVFLRPC